MIEKRNGILAGRYHYCTFGICEAILLENRLTQRKIINEINEARLERFSKGAEMLGFCFEQQFMMRSFYRY